MLGSLCSELGSKHMHGHGCPRQAWGIGRLSRICTTLHFLSEHWHSTLIPALLSFTNLTVLINFYVGSFALVIWGRRMSPIPSNLATAGTDLEFGVEIFGRGWRDLMEALGIRPEQHRTAQNPAKQTEMLATDESRSNEIRSRSEQIVA